MKQHIFKVNTVGALALAAVALVSFVFFVPVHFNDNLWLCSALLGWLIVLIASLSIGFKHAQVGVLCAGLATIAVMRISGIYDLYSLVIPAIFILILLFITFIVDVRDKLSIWESSMSFIRMYLGFDIMAHSAEKLFAGPMPYLGDVQAFVNLHTVSPDALVILAGLCEFGAAIALGLGFLTRLGAICTALYLFIATASGHHFSLGFIWANQGGGWEYPVMWTVFVLVFAVTGGGQYSLDALISKRFHAKWFAKLSGQSENSQQ
jgi:putative oxidoreductase